MLRMNQWSDELVHLSAIESIGNYERLAKPDVLGLLRSIESG